jgi:hypothetical protein
MFTHHKKMCIKAKMRQCYVPKTDNIKGGLSSRNNEKSTRTVNET